MAGTRCRLRTGARSGRLTGPTYRTGWNEDIALTKRTYTMSDLLNVFSAAGLWIETAIEPQLTDEAASR